MLDINLIRDQPDIVKKDLQKRGQEDKVSWVAEIRELDAEWKNLKLQVDDLRHLRNKLSLEISQLKKEKKDAAAALKRAADIPAMIAEKEGRQNEVWKRIEEKLMALPNVLHTSVPFGSDDDHNKVEAEFGKKPKLGFPAKSHVDLIEQLGFADEVQIYKNEISFVLTGGGGGPVPLPATAVLVALGMMTIGWRAERVRYAASDAADPAAPGFFFNSAAPEVRATQRQHAWELGLRHAPAPGWSLFGRAGRSFRFVNVDEIYENDAFFNAQFQILRPQHALTREAGAEWRGAGHALRATLFHTGVRDEIHLDPFSTGVGNRNLPPSRRQGIELDGTWRATGQLRLRAAYAYTDAKFLEGALAGGPFAIGTDLNIAGKRVPLVPLHKLNAGFDWEITGATRLTGTLTAVSRQFMDNDEPNTLGAKIPRHATLDMKLAHAFSWGRIAATVNNLFGSHYYTYAVRSAFVADRYAVYPLPGRTIGLSAELSMF